MENKLAEIFKETSKQYKAQKNSIDASIMKLKNNYRGESVNHCVSALLKIQEESGVLTERDLKIFINSLSLDLRDIYLS